MKKLLALVLSLVMALSLCVPAVSAADADIDNFQKVNTYTDQFSDISGWAVSVIQTCYEYGLMNGKGEGTFVPKGNLTVAEALVMACRVHEIYNTGASSLINGSPWYQPYVEYALANGIIAEGDFSAYNVNVTRAQMAYIFANALPASELSALKTVTTLPDVTTDAPYYEEILSLYKAGVLTGSDSYGTFKPDASITRQEAAAIIARVALPSMRSVAPLMENVLCTDGLTVCVPQGAEAEESADGTLSWTSDGYNVTVAAEAGYAGYDLFDVFTSAKPIEDIIAQSLGSQLQSDAVSSIEIKVGTANGYRTTFTVEESGLIFNCVFTVIIHDGTLYFVSALAVEGDPMLSTIVNNTRFDGISVSPAM